jgi:hypothetical protein
VCYCKCIINWPASRRVQIVQKSKIKLTERIKRYRDTYATLLNILSRDCDVFYWLTTVLAEEKGDGSQHYDGGYKPDATHHTPSAVHPGGCLMQCPSGREYDLILLQRQGNARATIPRIKKEDSDMQNEWYLNPLNSRGNYMYHLHPLRNCAFCLQTIFMSFTWLLE